MALTHVQLRDAIARTTKKSFAGEVHLPAGQFDVADVVELPAATGLSMVGEGAGRTIINSVGSGPLFTAAGGKFSFFVHLSKLKLEGQVGSGHLIDPDDDCGLSNFTFEKVWAHQREPNSSIWHQAITQRGLFFASFRDCRLECGTQSARSNVPAIDIDGVDNSFSSIWFQEIRFQCNHSKAPFFRATNSAGGNPLKQIVIRDSAVEQCQTGLLQVQATVALRIDALTFFDSVTPICGHFLEFQTGAGGLGNEGASVSFYYRAAGELGALAGPILTVASLTQTGGLATCTTDDPHGYATGDQVEPDSAAPASYEGLKTIAVTGPNTFTYSISAGAASPATPGDGGITVRRMQRAVASLSQAAGIATCDTVQAHDLEVGQRVFSDGWVQDDYNGLFTVLTVPDGDTFTFAVDAGAASPATGGGWAGIAAQDIMFGPDDVRGVVNMPIGGVQDAEIDINNSSARVDKNAACKVWRVPENTSTVLGVGAGASVETSVVKADSFEARTAGGQMSFADEIAALGGVEFGGNASISDMRVASSALDFPNVVAGGGTQDLDIEITGIGSTWRAVANPQSNIPAGLIPHVRTITDNVRIRLTNVTASDIDPGSITFVVTAWKH